MQKVGHPSSPEKRDNREEEGKSVKVAPAKKTRAHSESDRNAFTIAGVGGSVSQCRLFLPLAYVEALGTLALHFLTSRVAPRDCHDFSVRTAE